MSSESDVISLQFQAIYDLLGNTNKRHKELSDAVKTLHKNTKQAVKQAKTSKKRFQEKLILSKDLENFLSLEHGTKLTKAEVMKSVSDYIKSNNLQVLSNKRRFKPNKQMSKIFDMNTKSELTFVEINKHVSTHLSKSA